MRGEQLLAESAAVIVPSVMVTGLAVTEGLAWRTMK